MTQSFNKWTKGNSFIDINLRDINMMEDAFIAGAASRQEEVLQLQDKVDSLNKNIEALHIENEHIQKEYQMMFECVQGRHQTIDELTKMLHASCDHGDFLFKKMDELQERIDKLLEVANWHIEDCSLSHPMSRYELGWFEAMSLVKKIIEGEEGGK